MLTFHFGVMGSGKSAFALMTFHEKNRPAPGPHRNRAVLATTMDRSMDRVTSRTGMQSAAIQIVPGTVLAEQFADADTIVVDEAQFLDPADVDVLANLSAAGTEVLCFGLRTDFTARLFPGARRLLELADQISHMPIAPRCARCSDPALVNARFVNGVLTDTGDTVVLGDIASSGTGDQQVSYDPMCFRCWRAGLRKSTSQRVIDLREPAQDREKV